MTGSTTTVGIEVRADGTQEAARDLAVVDASLKKIQTDLGGTAQPAGVAAQGLEQLGAAGKSAGAGLGAVGASAKKAAEGLGSVSKFASTAKFDKVVSDLGAMDVKLNANSLHAQKLAKAMQQVERERAFRQLAADANLSTLQLAKFRAGLGDTRGALATLTTGFGLSKAAVLAFAAALAFGGRAALDAALQMDRLSKAYTTITGSSASAQQQLSYLYDVSNRLGLQFQSTAESAKTFFAAGKGSSLEKDMNGIFEAVASAGAALALSQDDMQGAFLALGQMISKGKVQAEELRGQLGERLPGAFQLAAKAMNMTTAELDKFMADGKLTAEELLPKLAKVMQEDFGTAAEAASQGLQGAINRLSTEWTLFKSSLVDSDAAVAGVNAVRGAVGGLQAAFDLLAKYKDVFKALAVGAGITTLISLVPRATEAVLGLASAFKTLLPLVIANPWVWAAAAIGAVAAGAYYYAESVDAATQAQKALDAAQKESIEINNALAKSQDLSASSLESYAKIAESTVSDIESKMSKLQESMNSALNLGKMSSAAEAPWMAYLMDDSVFNTLDEFEQRLVALRTEAAKTGDWQTLKRELDELAKEAQASGKDTAELQKAIEDTQRAANLGIQLSIQLNGYEETIRKLQRIRYLQKLYDGETVPYNESDWREKRDRENFAENKKFLEELDGLYKKTETSKREELQKTIVKLQEEEKYLNQRGLSEQDRLNAQTKLTAALAKARDDLRKLDEKDNKKDRSLEQAQRNLDAYIAELGKTEASIRSLQAQLATKPGEIFTREQAKIAAEYETTLKQIDKQAADYARKKGVSTEQVNQLKNQRLIEAGLKRDLDLRQAQEKEEKRLADLAKDKYDFYKELEELTGQYGLSLKYQSEAIAVQVKELERLEIPQEYINQWRELKELQASREWADGAQRAFLQYRADATDAAKGAEEAFSGLYSGMDSGFHGVWEQMLEDGKFSLSSFKSLFASFLADLMHMAITRPITVQIAGVVSGMLGTGGVAQAAGGSGGMGGIGNLSGVSNLMPGSWFSGIGDTINNTMAGWFPGTFASATAASSFAGQAAVSSALAEFGAGTSMATETAFNALADGIVAQNAAQSTFLSSVTPYFTAAGLGSLGYSMLGGKLGLPQSKYSGLTAGLGAAAGWGLGGMAAGSAALAGTGMAAGATFGSVVPVVGTIIGAIAGGALGSLFGQERKTHPSVYGHMMDQGYTTDAQSYIDAFMEQATYDRAGKTEASAYAQVIGEAASQTAGNILNLAAMLPDEYKKSVEDQLESATWSAGRGYSGASWNLQNWKKGMAEERIQEAVDDMFEQMGYGANKAFAEAGIGELFDSFDLSTEEGFKKAQTAISAISSITTAIDEIKAPTSEAEQQAKAFVAQMDALGEAVKASGLNAAYADKMIGEYRTAYVDKYVETLEEMFNPLSQIEQQAKGYKEAIDGYVSALTTMGASEAQLAQVRGYTRDAINNITGSLDAAFFPLSEVETQTKSTMESLLAYKAALETLGASAEELTRIDAAWGKMQSDLLDKARAYVSTTPEVVSQAAAMNAEFDALREAMLLAGNATADLTELEQIRAQAVAALQAQYVRSFDQGLAQRYATLNGTSDAVSRAISQENELRETITKFGEDSAQVSQLLHIQAAENVAAAQAAVDSLQNQLNSLKQQAIQAEISSITEQLNAAKTLKETWERLSESLYDSRAKLWTSDADALGLFAQRDAAQSEFDRLYRLTMQGDSEAAAKLASSGDTLLSLLKETSANGEQYTAGFWDVEQKLKDAESVAGKQLSEAQKSYNTLESQLKAQQSMLDALGYNNNSLDAINAQIVTVGNQLAKALGNLNAAQSNPNYGGTTSGGGYVSWQDKLLQEKADALNAGQTLAPGQTAGGWTPDKVLDAIKENGWTVADWYNYHGKAEGFAAGGLTPLNEMFSVGEAGKEYMLSPSQYVVLNNSMTRKLDEMQTLYRQTRQPVIDYRLMQMPVMGTDGDATAEIVKLREEVSELKNILRQTLTKTDTISANSGKIYRMAQKWDSDGLPATRTS